MISEYVRCVHFTGDGNRVSPDNLYKEYSIRLWIKKNEFSDPDIITSRVPFICTSDFVAWGTAISSTSPYINAVEVLDNKGNGVMARQA